MKRSRQRKEDPLVQEMRRFSEEGAAQDARDQELTQAKNDTATLIDATINQSKEQIGTELRVTFEEAFTWASYLSDSYQKYTCEWTSSNVITVSGIDDFGIKKGTRIEIIRNGEKCSLRIQGNRSKRQLNYISEELMKWIKETTKWTEGRVK